MSNGNRSTRSAGKKNSKQDKSSFWTMKIFYVLMLVLLSFGSIIRIIGASRQNQSKSTPASQVSSASNTGTAARVFTFYREDSGSGACIDLVIPNSGSENYSDCSQGTEKQYDLNDAERSQLRSWLAQFQPVNVDHTGASKKGNLTTRLYLNGLGSKVASETEVQSMIDFAGNLASKIASQP
jgi:cytoskeletal protein RodZ